MENMNRVNGGLVDRVAPARYATHPGMEVKCDPFRFKDGGNILETRS